MALPRRVLVVDDEESVAELTALQLTRADEAFDTDYETSVEDGLARLESDSIDCIVSDYDMPGRNGLEFLAAVRERDDDLPFILFTGKGSEEIASKAISAGVTDYVRKQTGSEQYEMLANRVRNAIDRYRTEQQLAQTEAQYDRLLNQELAGVYIIQDREFVFINHCGAAMLGYTPDELIGRDPLEIIAPEDRDQAAERLRQRLTGEQDSAHYTIQALHRSGNPVDIEIHGGRIRYDGDPAILGVVTETSDSTGEDLLRALDQATMQLMQIRERTEICNVAVRCARDSMDLPAIGIYLATGDDSLAAVERSQGFLDLFGDRETLTPADRFWDLYQSGEPARVGDGETIEEYVAVPLGHDGLLLAASVTGFDELEYEAIKLLAASTTAALTRTNYEERLERLHEATRKLMSAPSEQAVAEAATETARDVLGFDISSVHLLADDEERLVPVAVTQEATDALGSVPEFDSGDAMAWRAFEENTPHVYEDVREAPELYNPDTPIRSELIMPLGEYGVFLAGSPQPGDFDETAASLAKVFAANVETALRRADREERLRQREAELERKNEQLGEFASVVSHDLRNPLNVAEGHVQLAAESAQDESVEESLATADRAIERMSALIDDLLTLARQGRTVGDTEPITLASFVSDVWDTLDVDMGSLELRDDLGQIEADPDRLRQLVANLLRNTIDHGGSSVRTCVGPLEDASGFYIADDGPGIPDDQRERVFDHGYTTADEGTGFGLAIVRNIAQAHGWWVRVIESEMGGARFEIVTDTE